MKSNPKPTDFSQLIEQLNQRLIVDNRDLEIADRLDDKVLLTRFLELMDRIVADTWKPTPAEIIDFEDANEVYEPIRDHCKRLKVLAIDWNRFELLEQYRRHLSAENDKFLELIELYKKTRDLDYKIVKKKG